MNNAHIKERSQYLSRYTSNKKTESAINNFALNQQIENKTPRDVVDDPDFKATDIKLPYIGKFVSTKKEQKD